MAFYRVSLLVVAIFSVICFLNIQPGQSQGKKKINGKRRTLGFLRNAPFNRQITFLTQRSRSSTRVGMWPTTTPTGASKERTTTLEDQQWSIKSLWSSKLNWGCLKSKEVHRPLRICVKILRIPHTACFGLNGAGIVASAVAGKEIMNIKIPMVPQVCYHVYGTTLDTKWSPMPCW